MEKSVQEFADDILKDEGELRRIADLLNVSIEVLERLLKKIVTEPTMSKDIEDFKNSPNYPILLRAYREGREEQKQDDTGLMGGIAVFAALVGFLLKVGIDAISSKKE